MIWGLRESVGCTMVLLVLLALLLAIILMLRELL